MASLLWGRTLWNYHGDFVIWEDTLGLPRRFCSWKGALKPSRRLYCWGGHNGTIERLHYWEERTGTIEVSSLLGRAHCNELSRSPYRWEDSLEP